MTGIDQIRPLSAVGAIGTPSTSAARDTAQQVAGEIGHRILSWLSAATPVPGSGLAAWSERFGAGSGDFAPSPATLASRGDVYGLRDLAAGVSRQFGAGTVEEGALLRALEDFGRETAVQLGGLAGLDGARQITGVADALEQALSAAAPDTIDGVSQYLSDTASRLEAQRLA